LVVCITPPCPGPLICPSASWHTSHLLIVFTSAALPVAVTCVKDQDPVVNERLGSPERKRAASNAAHGML
jgi:hypothetical protein